jgi:tRNA modification GTPase
VIRRAAFDGIAARIAAISIAGLVVAQLAAVGIALLLRPHELQVFQTRWLTDTTLEIAGYAVSFADTAGVRESADAIEQQGVERAKKRAEHADLVLWLCDASAADGVCPVEVAAGVEVWQIFNAVDRLPEREQKIALQDEQRLYVSLKCEWNLMRLEQALRQKILTLCETSTPPLITQVRHRSALQATHAALARAARLDTPELMAEEMRQAALALGRLVGVVSPEEILGEVFGRFCIGK